MTVKTDGLPSERHLERWAEGEGPLEHAVGRNPLDNLTELLVAAERASVSMTTEEASSTLAAVLAEVRSTPANRPTRALRWLGAAAVLAAIAGAAAAWWRPFPAPVPARTVLVKRIVFEAEHEGKRVSLDLQVYKKAEGKGSDVTRP
jgi:hypothetical protein